MTLRRRYLYPLVGTLLALGAPVGHLALRACTCGTSPGAAWITNEVTALALTYVYLALSTTVVFGILGWILGSKEDLLQARATTDVLTGLSNRRHFDARLREEAGRAERYKTPLALLLIDVDNLKRHNAEGGHEGGDEALRAVGESLARAKRSTDLAARVGGDEFAVLTPMTRASEAFDLAERIRTTLRARRPGRFPTPTVSIGVAEGTKPEQLFADADHALFQAKENGRDRSCLAKAAPVDRE